MPGFRRLPNKYGTITKLSGKRRKPYCARKYAGDVWDEDKQRLHYRYISVGTFSTRREALDALAKANADENYAKEAISFGAVADKWLEEKRPEISEGLYRVYKSAMIKFTPIRKRQMRSLKTDDLERLLNSDNVPRTVKGKCKIALNGIYDYAIRHEYVDKDYSALVRVHADQKAQIERVSVPRQEVIPDLLFFVVIRLPAHDRFSSFTFYAESIPRAPADDKHKSHPKIAQILYR